MWLKNYPIWRSYNFLRWTLIFHINIPSSLTVETFVGCVTSPQTLDEHRSGWNLAIEMLLALLLLYFQSKTRTQNTLKNDNRFKNNVNYILLIDKQNSRVLTGCCDLSFFKPFREVIFPTLVFSAN